MDDSQLSELFENVQAIRGVVQIWNTQLTSVTFMKKIQNITGDPLDRGLSILNNTEMISILLTSLTYSDEKIEIENNPKLNLQKHCSTIHDVYFNRRSITGNLFDCGCEIHSVFTWSKTLNFPEKCIVLYGNLAIEGNAPPYDLLYRLSTITKIFGDLRITDTNLETLGFLQNLESVESGETWKCLLSPKLRFAAVDSEYTISIKNNPFLRRLDFLNLQSVKSRNLNSSILFSGNDVLCMDPGIVQLFGQSSILSVSFGQSMTYCDSDKMNNPSTYCRGKLTAINDRCTRYIGDLIFTDDNSWNFTKSTNYKKLTASYLKKIQQFEVIFGTIFIEGSNLTILTLPNLREIYQISNVQSRVDFGDALYLYQLGTGVAIQLSRNEFLIDFLMPNLKIASSIILVKDNFSMKMDGNFCKNVSSGVKRLEILGLNSEYDCRYSIDRMNEYCCY